MNVVTSFPKLTDGEKLAIIRTLQYGLSLGWEHPFDMISATVAGMNATLPQDEAMAYNTLILKSWAKLYRGTGQVPWDERETWTTNELIEAINDRVAAQKKLRTVADSDVEDEDEE